MEVENDKVLERDLDRSREQRVDSDCRTAVRFPAHLDAPYCAKGSSHSTSEDGLKDASRASDAVLPRHGCETDQASVEQLLLPHSLEKPSPVSL